MPYKSDKQRRLVKCVQSGGCKGAGMTKAAADKFAKHAADGGRVKPTGSAGTAAPTIATSARHYADGGKVQRMGMMGTPRGGGLSSGQGRGSLRKPKTAAQKAEEDRKKRARAVAVTEEANRRAVKRRARTGATARSTASPAKPSTTAKPSKPTRARGKTASSPPPKPALKARKPLAKVTATARRPAGGGGPAARKGGAAGDKAKLSLGQRLRKMNKAAVQRAGTGHRSEDDSR